MEHFNNTIILIMPYTQAQKKLYNYFQKVGFKRKRAQRKKFFKGMITSKKSNSNIARGVYYFKRTLSWQSDTVVSGNFSFTAGTGCTITSNTSDLRIGWSGGVGVHGFARFRYQFDISNLPNLTEFTNLFDAYRILKVVLKLVPYNTVSASDIGAAGFGLGGAGAVLHYVIDHDSANIPADVEAGIQDLQQYASYRTMNLVNSIKPIKIVIKPKATMEIEKSDGSAQVGAELKRNTWLDLVNTTIPHFGLRAIIEGIQPTANTSTFAMRVETTYYMAFKGVR